MISQVKGMVLKKQGILFIDIRLEGEENFLEKVAVLSDPFLVKSKNFSSLLFSV